jgi:hypothetical protein
MLILANCGICLKYSRMIGNSEETSARNPGMDVCGTKGKHGNCVFFAAIQVFSYA